MISRIVSNSRNVGKSKNVGNRYFSNSRDTNNRRDVNNSRTPKIAGKPPKPTTVGMPALAVKLATSGIP
jgi:hypothetical protein